MGFSNLKLFINTAGGNYLFIHSKFLSTILNDMRQHKPCTSPNLYAPYLIFSRDVTIQYQEFSTILMNERFILYLSGWEACHGEKKPRPPQQVLVTDDCSIDRCHNKRGQKAIVCFSLLRLWAKQRA